MAKTGKIRSCNTFELKVKYWEKEWCSNPGLISSKCQIYLLSQKGNVKIVLTLTDFLLCDRKGETGEDKSVASGSRSYELWDP